MNERESLFVFCLNYVIDCNSSGGKVNKRSTICEKLVGIGSVMDNYVGAIPHVLVIT